MGKLSLQPSFGVDLKSKCCRGLILQSMYKNVNTNNQRGKFVDFGFSGINQQNKKLRITLG
jgi:hypothetical protein